jgi:general secretion pathway protein G
MKSARQRGFTLIEVLVTLVLIGLLSGLMINRMFTSLDDGRWKSLKPKVRRLEQAVETYRLDTGQIPQDLDELINRPDHLVFWGGPYLEPEEMIGPWGHPVHFEHTDDNQGYLLTFYAKDGQPGGRDFNADVSNRRSPR